MPAMPRVACLLLLLAQPGLAVALRRGARAVESAGTNGNMTPTDAGALAGVISAMVHGFSLTKPEDMMTVATSVGIGAGMGALIAESQKAKCKKVSVQEGFDLQSYISAPWYAQWQNEQEYQRANELNCTLANYTQLSTLPNGWQIDVSNRGRTGRFNGDTSGFLCAKQVEGAKLKVAPCFLPSDSGGPYWVANYSKTEGYAIILGGQPNWPTTDGLCAYNDPMNNGMWIFTRERNPDPELLTRLKSYMKDTLKIDTSKMLRTPQDVGCAKGER